MFSHIESYVDDPIEAFQARLQKCTLPAKLDLGLGIYRNEQGEVAVFDAVMEAERRMAEAGDDKGYRAPTGNASYIEAMEKLLFNQVLDGNLQVSSVQTPGAGAACRLGAEYIRELSPDSRVWVSVPNWGHQVEFFARTGLEIKYYPYYDLLNSTSQFDEILNALEAMQEGDVLLLHGCCHNPTGHGPSLQQWQALTDLCIKKRVLPLVDIAYQGFGDGIDEDLAGMQLMASQVPEMMVVVSSSKSFAVYRERAGLLSLIFNENSENIEKYQDNAVRMLRDLARGLYFMPPDHGAELVAEVLKDDQLNALWRQELDSIRLRIYGLRSMLKDAIESIDPNYDANYLVEQKGMFSCLSLTPAQQQIMEEDHGIFMLPNARINFAALAQSSAGRLAEAFVKTSTSQQ